MKSMLMTLVFSLCLSLGQWAVAATVNPDKLMKLFDNPITLGESGLTIEAFLNDQDRVLRCYSVTENEELALIGLSLENEAGSPVVEVALGDPIFAPIDFSKTQAPPTVAYPKAGLEFRVLGAILAVKVSLANEPNNKIICWGEL
jgi:hypothetical protein